MKKLLERLFGVEVKHYKRRDSNVMILRMTGVNLVEFLVKRGLFIGDKIKRQVGVPSWIKQKSSYRSACLRGLMDTDGGVFDHRYKVRGKGYQYKKICFVNRSLPILNFVKEEFENIGLNPKMRNKRSVWLYSENEVLKYMQLVGSHNKRLLEKFLGGVHRTGKVAPC